MPRAVSKAMIVYGLIPVRHKSSGLPGKNLRPLCKRPLISYMIQAALAAKTIHTVFVSTDSPKISNLARSLGAQVIIHPRRLSKPGAPTFGVIKNAISHLRKLGQDPTVIATMRATSPLCLPQDIDGAVRLLFSDEKADSVVSVARSDVHPHRVLRINSRGELEHFDRNSPEMNFPKPRQAFETVFVRNGAIYATRSKIIEGGSLWGNHCLPFIMPKERSVNINDYVDFLLAEALMKKRTRNRTPIILTRVLRCS